MNERIIAIVGDCAGTPVDPGTKFSSLKIDSLDFLQVLTDVEQLLGIRFDNQQIIKMDTVGDLMKIAGELHACR